jgi:hypothetical protein
METQTRSAAESTLSASSRSMRWSASPAEASAFLLHLLGREGGEPAVALQAAQILPGRDLLHPAREGPFPPELGDPLEGRQERVLGGVVASAACAPIRRSSPRMAEPCRRTSSPKARRSPAAA